MPANQGGAGGFKLTAEERRLSQRASLQKDGSLQSEARQASHASSSQVFLFHQNFLPFHHFWLEKEASDMMPQCWRRLQDTRTRVMEAVNVVPDHPGGSAAESMSGENGENGETSC